MNPISEEVEKTTIFSGEAWAHFFGLSLRCVLTLRQSYYWRIDERITLSELHQIKAAYEQIQSMGFICEHRGIISIRTGAKICWVHTVARSQHFRI